MKDQEGRPAVKVPKCLINRGNELTFPLAPYYPGRLNSDTWCFVLFCATSTLSWVSISRYVTHGAFYVRNKSMNVESTMVVEQEVPVQKYEQMKLGSHLHFWPLQKTTVVL